MTNQFDTDVYRLKTKETQTCYICGSFLRRGSCNFGDAMVPRKEAKAKLSFLYNIWIPFVGDAGLHEAVARENWSGNFCHVVSQYDVVPRMLLAPVESILESLIAILPYWESIMVNDSKHVPDSFMQDAGRTLLRNVLQYIDTKANYGVDYRSELDGLIKRSPYRPFGTYMFCSGEGVACIDNSKTVLKMLHLTMQSHEKPCDTTVQDCFSEHIGYGSVLERVIEKTVSRRRSPKPDLESSYKMGISLQLEAIGVGVQVRGNGTVYYPSNLEPWSETYGWKSPGFDPLKHAIEEAHSQNMALHAWVNVMPSWRGSHPPTHELHMYCSHPEWSWYDRYGNRQNLAK